VSAAGVSAAMVSRDATAGEDDDDGRASLRELGAGLRDLHRALLEQQRLEYENRELRAVGGAQLLHLVAHDPAFAWLRVLSALMVDLDTLLEEPAPPSEDELAAIRRELEGAFSPAAPEGFWEKLTPLLQAPAAAIGYGRVRAVLAKLPRIDPGAAAAQLHANHRWAVARRMRGVV
jgi:hypothetical protein